MHCTEATFGGVNSISCRVAIPFSEGPLSSYKDTFRLSFVGRLCRFWSVLDRGFSACVSYFRFIGQALTADEKGERMAALELYNKSLSTIRSGLAILQSSVGMEAAGDSTLHEIRGKMER